MRILDDITKFIFVCDEPKPCDLIFIPGSSKYEVSEKASLLYKQRLAKYVLPSGKFSCKLEKFPNEKIINKKDGVVLCQQTVYISPTKITSLGVYHL